MATTMQQSRSKPVEASPMDYEALRLRHLVDMRSHIPTLKISSAPRRNALDHLGE